MRDGEGIETFYNGEKYVGDYREDNKEGQVKQFYRNNNLRISQTTFKKRKKNGRKFNELFIFKLSGMIDIYNFCVVINLLFFFTGS